MAVCNLESFIMLCRDTKDTLKLNFLIVFKRDMFTIQIFQSHYYLIRNISINSIVLFA